METPEKLTFEVYGEVDDMDFEPDEWADCENLADFKNQVLEIAHDRSSWGISLAGGLSFEDLWKRVQEKTSESP